MHVVADCASLLLLMEVACCDLAAAAVHPGGFGAAAVHPGGFSGLECEECQYSGLDLPSSLGAPRCTLPLEEENGSDLRVTLKCSHCGGQRSELIHSYCAARVQKMMKMVIVTCRE